LWGPPQFTDPLAFAFRIYRNYDGAGAGFGETYVSSTSGRSEQSRGVFRPAPVGWCHDYHRSQQGLGRTNLLAKSVRVLLHWAKRQSINIALMICRPLSASRILISLIPV